MRGGATWLILALLVATAVARADEADAPPRDARRPAETAGADGAADDGPEEPVIAPDALPDAPAPGPRRPVVLALALSGAASVGSYEAGWLYAVLEAAKRRPDVLDLRLVTGTSAGGINALLAVLSRCGPPQDRPTESDLWRTWIPIGFDDLFDPERVTATSAFTDAALRATASALEGQWREGLPDTCDLVMGVTATRVDPVTVPLAGDLVAVPRTEEKFVVRVRGRGPWRRPRVENYPPRNPGVPVPLLPLDGEDDRPSFGLLRDLVLASAAYPIAFPPVDLPHCLADGDGDAPGTCTPDDATSAGFVDGGFFDNRPLRLAVNVATQGLEPHDGSDDGVRWADERVVDPRPLPERVIFLVLDPWAYAFPDVPTMRDEDDGASLTGLVMRTLGNFIDASRAKEIQTVLEERPSVRGRLVPSRTMYPTASSPLGAFLGFFEQSFRELDFFLGMHDALAQLERARPRLEAAGYDASGLADLPTETPEEGTGWRRYRCVAAALGDDPAAAAQACGGPDLRPIRVLVQVTLERLYERCATAAEHAPPIPPPVPHARCEAAQDGEAPPRIVTGYATVHDGWRRRPGEDELAHMLRRLAAYEFPFRDLGLHADEAAKAPGRLRSRLEKVIDRLADAQGVDGMVVDALGEQLLGAIAYVPPASLGHVTVGPVIEAGWSGTAPEGSVPWLRGSVALRVDGLGSLLSSQDAFFALTPLAGVEVELLPLSNATVQPRLGARAGYVFSTIDAGLTGDCAPEARRSRQTRCSRFRTQAYAALSLWGLVRFQVDATVDPPLRDGERTAWEIHPGLGVQF